MPKKNDSSSDDDGGGGLTKDALPGWIWNPRSFIFKRITEFFVVAVVTAVSGVGQAILDGFLWVRRAFVDAGDAIAGSGAYIGGGALSIVVSIERFANAITQMAGPLALPVWIVIIAVAGLVVFRLVKAGIAFIPFVGPGLKTLLFGAYASAVLTLLVAVLELVGGGAYA